MQPEDKKEQDNSGVELQINHGEEQPVPNIEIQHTEEAQPQPAPQTPLQQPQQAPDINKEITAIEQGYKDLIDDKKPEQPQSSGQPRGRTVLDGPNEFASPATNPLAAQLPVPPLKTELPKSKKPRSIKLLFVITIILALIVGAGLIYLNKKSSTNANLIKTYTVQNDSNSYSFSFYGDGSPIKIKSGQANLNGVYSKTYHVYGFAFNGTHQQTCDKVQTNATVLMKVNIQNVNYPVCSEVDQRVVYTYFKYSGNWQEAALYTTKSGVQVNKQFASKMFTSISIN